MDWFRIQIKNPITYIFFFILLTISLLILHHSKIINLGNDLPNQLIQLLGIFTGVLLIAWQIDTQHRNSIKLQEDTLKQKIKLDVFSELDKTLSQCQESLINIGTTILLLPMKFSTQIQMVSEFSNKIPNYQPVPMRERAQDITNDHSQAMKNIISVMYILEKYEIIFPDKSIKLIMDKFQKRMDEAGKSFIEAHKLFGKYLPMDIPEGKSEKVGNIYTPPLPNSEQLKDLKNLTDEYYKNTTYINGYIYDIRRESQNLLLGSLFNRKLPPRQPTDPSFDVITFPDAPE